MIKGSPRKTLLSGKKDLKVSTSWRTYSIEGEGPERVLSDRAYNLVLKLNLWGVSRREYITDL